ncbi:unnamed protein product [Lampetra planeri]
MASNARSWRSIIHAIWESERSGARAHGWEGCWQIVIAPDGVAAERGNSPESTANEADVSGESGRNGAPRWDVGIAGAANGCEFGVGQKRRRESERNAMSTSRAIGLRALAAAWRLGADS